MQIVKDAREGRGEETGAQEMQAGEQVAGLVKVQTPGAEMVTGHDMRTGGVMTIELPVVVEVAAVGMMIAMTAGMALLLPMATHQPMGHLPAIRLTGHPLGTWTIAMGLLLAPLATTAMVPLLLTTGTAIPPLRGLVMDATTEAGVEAEAETVAMGMARLPHLQPLLAIPATPLLAVTPTLLLHLRAVTAMSLVGRRVPAQHQLERRTGMQQHEGASLGTGMGRRETMGMLRTCAGTIAEATVRTMPPASTCTPCLTWCRS